MVDTICSTDLRWPITSLRKIRLNFNSVVVSLPKWSSTTYLIFLDLIIAGDFDGLFNHGIESGIQEGVQVHFGDLAIGRIDGRVEENGKKLFGYLSNRQRVEPFKDLS